jgi:hypothetical protein
MNINKIMRLIEDKIQLYNVEMNMIRIDEGTSNQAYAIAFSIKLELQNLLNEIKGEE